MIANVDCFLRQTGRKVCYKRGFSPLQHFFLVIGDKRSLAPLNAKQSGAICLQLPIVQLSDYDVSSRALAKAAKIYYPIAAALCETLKTVAGNGAPTNFASLAQSVKASMQIK